jgi:hypothetical protein
LLVGAIYGLAIYNSIIIYVPFPLVLYKKILGESIMLDDLSDLYPTLTNSLRSLLEYPDEDVEEVRFINRLPYMCTIDMPSKSTEQMTGYSSE